MIHKPKRLSIGSNTSHKDKLRIQKEQLDKCKESARQMIDSCRTLNSDLQFKISYFYGPYNGITRRNPLIPMNFVDENNDDKAHKPVDFQIKQKNWK